MLKNEFISLKKNGFDTLVSHIKNIKKHEEPIMLSYPAPDSSKSEFNEFFSSLERKNSLRNDFKGVFAIELTDYISFPQDKHLFELSGFMKENNDVFFVLFAGIDKAHEADRLIEGIKRMTDCIVGKIEDNRLEWIPRKSSFPTQDSTFGY